MKRTGKCPKCDGSDVIPDVKAIDRGDSNVPHKFSLATFRKPEALIFKGKKETTVSAWMCAACGYAEFYADSPGTIKQSEAP